MNGKSKNLSYGVMLDYYGALLTERQRELLDCYYNEDYSLSEIAENFEMTRQGVQNGIRAAEKNLFDIEKKLGFISKFSSIRKETACGLQVAKLVIDSDLTKMTRDEMKIFVKENAIDFYECISAIKGLAEI